MSVDTFPFATSEDMGQYDETDAGNKKKLVIAGGAVAALVLGAAFFLMSGGGSESTDEFIPRAPRVAKAAAAPQTAAKTTAKQLPAAYQDQIGRDPFKPLYVVPAAAPAAAAPPVASTTTSSTSSGPATTTTSSGDTASTSATQVAPAPAPATTRYALKLTAISQTNDAARFTTWSVDGQKTTVLPAQKFGKYGELVVLAFSKNAQGAVDKAILQVGDDSPMEVAVGQTNSVL